MEYTREYGLHCIKDCTETYTEEDNYESIDYHVDDNGVPKNYWGRVTSHQYGRLLEYSYDENAYVGEYIGGAKGVWLGGESRTAALPCFRYCRDVDDGNGFHKDDAFRWFWMKIESDGPYCYCYSDHGPSAGTTGRFTFRMGGLCLRNNDYGCKDNACANEWVAYFLKD